MKKRLKKDNIIFFLLFYLSVIIDNINGYLQVQLGMRTPIGQMFRIFIIGLVLSILIKKKKNVEIFIVTAFSMVFLCMLWTSFFSAKFMREIVVLIRMAYIPLMIMYFCYAIKHYDKIDLLAHCSRYGLLISIVIILCFVLNIGNNTYHASYGFGTKGFFKAGNDLSLTLVFSLILSCFYHVQNKGNKWSLARCGIIAFGCILIGTRVGMILGVFVFCAFLFFNLIKSKRNNKIAVIVGTTIVFIISLFLSIAVYNSLDNWTLSRFETESMQNVRGDFKDESIRYISRFDTIDKLIGEGYGNLGKNIANGLDMEINEKSVEADWHEMIGSYGYGFGGLIILYYISFVYIALKKYLKYKSLENFVHFSIVLIFIVVGYIAGHAIKNTMVAPIYGIVAAYIILSQPIKYNSKRRHYQ